MTMPSDPLQPHSAPNLRDVAQALVDFQRLYAEMTWDTAPGNEHYGKMLMKIVADACAALESEVQPPAAAPQEKLNADGLAMVRWQTRQQGWLQKLIADYPQCSYQRELDVVESLPELVESQPLQPAAAAPPIDLDDLIKRLRASAFTEMHDGSGLDPLTESERDEAPEITWDELAEIAALLTEAADMLARLRALQGTTTEGNK